jgi:hypothetical protein
LLANQPLLKRGNDVRNFLGITRTAFLVGGGGRSAPYPGLPMVLDPARLLAWDRSRRASHW